MEDNNNVKKANKRKVIIVVAIVIIFLIIIISVLLLNIKSTKKTSNVNSNKQIDNLNKQKKDSDNKSNENAESKNSNNNNQIEKQKEYVDESYVCPEGLEMLADFIGYRGVFGPNNMLDDKDIRIQYIQFLLMNENKVTWTTGAYQSFPYINESSFVNKYNEVFDSAKYNYVNDQDSTKFIDCNNYEETKNKNYKCWNGTWGVYGNKIYLYVNNKNDNYISGEFKRSSNESGKFEIKYTIKNNKKYLNSIIMYYN